MEVSELDDLAVRVLHDYRRRDGLTSYNYDSNRLRDEKHMKEAFAQLVAPALSTQAAELDALRGEVENSAQKQLALIELVSSHEATIAQLRDRVAGLEEGLDWYGKTFCELGSSHECCGRLQTDDCSGCKARALLTQNEVG